MDDYIALTPTYAGRWYKLGINHRDRYYRVTADRENNHYTHTGVRTFSRVSFRGIQFKQYHILFHPADRAPSRKETPRWTVLYKITRQFLRRASIH
jgi:hypothetical protein